MIDELADRCMSLSSGNRFLQEAADRIGSPSSYLLLHPATISVEQVMFLLCEELDNRKISLHEIDVAEIDADHIPESLCSYLQIDIDGRDARSIAPIFEKLGDINVIYLAGLNTCSRACKKKWIRFLNRWSDVVKQRIDMKHSATVFLAATDLEAAMAREVKQDTTMRVAWWWGIPSNLEMQLVCRHQRQNDSDSLEAQWREAMAAALASGDLEFLEKIWEFLTRDTGVLLDHMRKYGEARRWTRDRIAKLLEGSSFDYRRSSFLPAWYSSQESLLTEPPEKSRAAWTEGLLFFSLEHGCELHAAAASQLDDSIAKSRIWRAQLGLISPQLDIARSMICQSLTKRFGHDWPTRYVKPKDDQEFVEVVANPLSCQLGHLKRVLEHSGELQRANSNYRVLAKRALEIRNELSHLRPVSYEMYRAFHDTARNAIG